MDALNSWVNALDDAITKGNRFVDNEGRACLELLHHTLVLEPKGLSKPLDEMRRFDAWSFPTPDEINRALEQRDRSVGYSVGNRVFAYRGSVDQLNGFVIPLLKKDINSRRAMIVLYDPEQDSRIGERMTPCLALIYFKAHDGKLDVSCYIRSNDLLLGCPLTILQLSSLQEMALRSLRLNPGNIIVHSGSAHVYEDNASVAKEVIDRCRKNL